MQKIKYEELNSKQKEIFNFQKVAALLAGYGYNCMKLSDDWNGADFIAYHYKKTETLKVQLKSRISIHIKYSNKLLWVAFPLNRSWYFIEHDVLVQLIKMHTAWLDTKSWKEKSGYSSSSANEPLKFALSSYLLDTNE